MLRKITNLFHVQPQEQTQGILHLPVEVILLIASRLSLKDIAALFLGSVYLQSLFKENLNDRLPLGNTRKNQIAEDLEYLLLYLVSNPSEAKFTLAYIGNQLQLKELNCEALLQTQNQEFMEQFTEMVREKVKIGQENDFKLQMLGIVYHVLSAPNITELNENLAHVIFRWVDAVIIKKKQLAEEYLPYQNLRDSLTITFCAVHDIQTYDKILSARLYPYGKSGIFLFHDFSINEYDQLKKLLEAIDASSKYVYLGMQLKNIEESHADHEEIRTASEFVSQIIRKFKKIRTGPEFVSQLKKCLEQHAHPQAKTLCMRLICEPKKNIFINLAGALLSKLHLEKVDLSYANLSHATLNESSFSSVKLTGADLSYVKATGLTYLQADMALADLTGADFSEVRFYPSSLRGAILKDIILEASQLKCVAIDESTGVGHFNLLNSKNAFIKMISANRNISGDIDKLLEFLPLKNVSTIVSQDIQKKITLSMILPLAHWAALIEKDDSQKTLQVHHLLEYLLKEIKREPALSFCDLVTAWMKNHPENNAAIDHHSHFVSSIASSVVGFFSEPHAKKTTTRILLETLMKKSQDIYLEWQRSSIKLEENASPSTFVTTAFRKKQ